MTPNLSPAEIGRHLAAAVTITDEQAMEFARILLSAPVADYVRTGGAV